MSLPLPMRLTLSKVMHPNLTKDKLYAGLFFSGCTVTAEDGVADGAYYLGRPWKEMCGTMFLNCKLGKHINAKGWKEWSGAENKCSYLEYNNTDLDGNALNLSERAAFSYQANDVEVAEYLNPQYLFKKFSDVPFNYAKILRGAAAPTGFVVTPTGFTWQADEQAAGYLVYKDGQFVAFTAQPEYTKTDGENDQAIYTVRSVSRHGVTSHGVFARAEGDILAFPTAGGFGKYATGGRGGKVVTVTSLDDVETQKGTLRWAFKQYPDEPLTIVFAVSGEIALRSDLRVNRADWTLAGQTAPGDGIVITRNKVNFGGSQNFIVRNMRFRVGQKNYGGDINAVNAVGAENCANYIFDHCDFGWSVEENMNTADCHFLTVQYSMVHEGLYNAGHSKGARGYGCQWGGSPATYHHNLLAAQQVAHLPLQRSTRRRLCGVHGIYQQCELQLWRFGRLLWRREHCRDSVV